MIEQRRSAAAGRARLIELVGEDGRHAFVGERADRDGAGGDRFGALGIDAAIEPQNAEAGAESLFGCSRLASTATISPSVLGPIFAAQWRKRSGVHSA